MPAWTEEEKFDGQTLGLFIERGLATTDSIMAAPVYDLATCRPVGKYLNNADWVIHILPIADKSGADNGFVTFIRAHRVRNMLGRDYDKNNSNYRRYPESHGTSQTSSSSSAW